MGNEGSREREDWMSEVKFNSMMGQEKGWIEVGAARCDKYGQRALVEG